MNSYTVGAGLVKVLVTGGMGYIGSHTCIALHEAGITPVIFDNLSNSSEKVLTQLHRITGQHFEFIRGDIRDTEQLKNVFANDYFDAVFHFAALKAVGESTEVPLRYYQNNVSGTATMLEVMNQANIKKVIFSSSATVYGEPQYLPLDEQHPISATNPYGWTKVMVEQVLQDLCQADASWLAISLRYFNPVGAHDSGLIGESPNGIPNNLMPFIAQTAVGKRDVVSVFGDDYDTADGTGVRDYIHIMDLAQGHVDAYLHHKNDQSFHPYNLGRGTGYSVLEMIKAFSESAKKEIPYKLVARRTGDVACNYANAEKAANTLNWHAKYNLKDMTDHTWQWQTNYPNGLEN